MPTNYTTYLIDRWRFNQVFQHYFLQTSKDPLQLPDSLLQPPREENKLPDDIPQQIEVLDSL